MLRKIDKITKEVLMVTKVDWVHVYQNVKNQCTSVAKGLIENWTDGSQLKI